MQHFTKRCSVFSSPLMGEDAAPKERAEGVKGKHTVPDGVRCLVTLRNTQSLCSRSTPCLKKRNETLVALHTKGEKED
jgi:hypothetical protein